MIINPRDVEVRARYLYELAKTRGDLADGFSRQVLAAIQAIVEAVEDSKIEPENTVG